MKVLIWIIILVVIGYFAYNQFNQPLSDQEQAVKDLEGRFNTASRAFVGAVRMAGETGLDTTSDAEMAINKIKKIRTELSQLKPTLSEEGAIDRSDKLETRITEFYKKNDLR